MAVPIIEVESINAISMQQDICNEEISNKSEDKCFKIKAKKLDSRDKETAFDQQGVKTKESSHAVHFTILACVLTEMKRWLEYECNRQNPCKASYVKDFKREVLKYGIKYKERRKLKFIHNFVKSFYSIPKTYLHTFMLRAQEYNKFINEKTLQTMSCRDSMQFEWARLSSFANYPVTGPSAIRLAGAGFYYEGQEDEVVCYFCGYRHKQWNNKDDPRVIHKQQSPNCPFVKHNLSAVCARQMSLNEQTSECSGVSGMTETCLQQQTQISENHLYTCQCEKNDTIVNKRNSENEDEETRSLILETQNNSIINDQSNTTQTVVSEITQPTVLPTPASTTAVSKITQPTVLPTPAATTAVSEITQQTVLPTPAATTVVSEITQPTVLPTTTVSKITQPTVLPKPAATTAVSEITQPTVLPEPSTATIVSQITTSEADPYDIFNNGSRNNTSGLIRVNENASVQQPISEFILSQGPENLGICVDRPKYPSYAITATRLSSFAGWPEYIDQTPERLATAGFFYTGTGDHCRCFYCGGGLRQWEEEDLPWTEHARWYPNCPFVKQSKGHEFINAVLKGKDPERHQQRGTKNVNGYLNNPALQTILDFGYDEDLVKRLYTSLNHSGIQDINASLLLETIFEMDESKRHSSTNEPTPFLNNKVPNENTGTKEATPPLNNNIPKENTGATTKEPTPSLNNNISKENTGTKSNEKEHGVNTNVEHELSIRSLEEENRNLKDQQTCKICLDEPVAIVFLPCGHLAACVICAPALRKCPICRAFIRGTVKAIM